jgi:prepilin-type N-terminal cleavage/methylation domain-containing protein
MPTSSVGKTSKVGSAVGQTPRSARVPLDPLPGQRGRYLAGCEPAGGGAGRGPGGPPHQPRRGVTLVEMVVVVAIIALIVGISFPAASAGLDNVRMVSASDSVATFLNAAVNRAERHQQPVELVISPQEGRLALYSNEPGFTRELKMPDGVGIEAVLPAEEGGDPAQPRRILFLPGATVPGIAIQLGNRRNAHRRVRLDPMTGFPRVESVEIK